MFPYHESHQTINLTAQVPSNKPAGPNPGTHTGTGDSDDTKASGIAPKSTHKPVLKMSIGAIVGVSVGVLMLFATALVTIFFVKRKVHRKKEKQLLLQKQQQQQELLLQQQAKKATAKPKHNVLKFTDPDQIVCNTVSRDTFETGMWSFLECKA